MGTGVSLYKFSSVPERCPKLYDVDPEGSGIGVRSSSSSFLQHYTEKRYGAYLMIFDDK